MPGETAGEARSYVSGHCVLPLAPRLPGRRSAQATNSIGDGLDNRCHGLRRRRVSDPPLDRRHQLPDELAITGGTGAYCVATRTAIVTGLPPDTDTEWAIH
jgi:hypothetical protein